MEMDFEYTIAFSKSFEHFEISCSEPELHALRFKREDREEVRRREYTKKAGIYFLFGPDTEIPRKVYIGKAGPERQRPGVVERIYERHTRGNEADVDALWTDAFLFVHDGRFLQENGTRVSFLERGLIADALEQREGTFALINKQERGGCDHLSRHDIHILEKYKDHCKTMLRLVGLPVFNPPRRLVQQAVSQPNVASANLPVEPSASNENVMQQVYFHNFNGKVARCVKQSDNTCILLKNSFLQKVSAHPRAEETRRRRQELKDKFVGDDRNGYHTTVDIEFRSLNQAGMFVTGNAACQAKVFWRREEGVGSMPSAPVVPSAPHELFFFASSRCGYDAKGFLTANGQFTVCAGSRARVATTGDADKVAKYRRVKGDSIDASGVFRSDTTFSSPSAAAAFVYLGASNGWKAWKDERGRPLKTHTELRSRRQRR